MNRIFVVVGIIVAIPVVLIAALATLLANPENYRDELTSTVASTTGYHVSLGELSWRYWPPVALDINNVELRNAATAEPFATLSSASVDLNLFPLLGGSLIVNGLYVEGVNVNAVVAADGSANWEVESAAASDTPDAEQSSGSGEAMDLQVQALRIEDITVNYQDFPADSHYVATLSQLVTSAIAWDDMMTVDIAVVLEDKKADMKLTSDIKGALSVNQAVSQLKLQQLAMNNVVQMPDFPTTDVSLTLTGDIDLEQDTANLTALQIGVAGLIATVSTSVEGLTADVPRLQGNLTTNTFNAKELMAAFDLPAVATAKPEAMTSLQLSADFAGTPQSLGLNNMKLALDNSAVTGTATLTPGEITDVKFDLTLDTINVSEYMAPDEEPVAASGAVDGGGEGSNAGTTAAAADSEVIPVETLRTVTVDGKFKIATLQYDTYTFSNFVFGIKNRDALLTTNLTLTGYEGSIANESATRYASNVSTTNTLTVRGIDLPSLAETESITGHITVDAKHRMNGSMLSQIMNSLDGTSQFQVVDGTVDVTPVKNMASMIDGLRGKQSSVSQWPDLMPFKQLNGSHKFVNGTKANQTLNFALENLVGTGGGGFDYFANTLDFNLTIQLTESEEGQFSVGPALANVRWPVHCEGPLDGSPADICLPDSDSVKTIVADIAKGELKRKGEKELNKLIEDKVPEGLKNTLKGLFKR